MKTALPLIVFAAALTLACHASAVFALPALQKTGSPTPPVAPSAPYELKLSLMSDFSSQQSGIPNPQVRLVNATQYELVYRWTPLHTVTFLVEYKAASEDPGREAGWKQLTSIAAPSPTESYAQSDEHVERKQIHPGQEENLFFLPPSLPLPTTSLPLPKEGYYRITATLTLPRASEFRGTVSPSTLVRSFKLVVSSKPLVIRHTATGFAEVPATASAAPAR